MSRLIDADALIALVQDSTILKDGFKYAFDALVKGEPTVDANHIADDGKKVDAVPVKHGHWIEEDEEIIEYKCSECGVYQYGNFGEILNGEFHFCPNCGAKMDGERKNDA